MCDLFLSLEEVHLLLPNVAIAAGTKFFICAYTLKCVYQIYPRENSLAWKIYKQVLALGELTV